MRTVPCMHLNSPKHKLNANSQILWGFSICKKLSTGTLLQLVHQLFWRKRIRRIGIEHRFAVSCSRRKVAEKLFKTWKITQWEQLWSRDCIDSFTADASGSLFPWMCCDKHKKYDQREAGLFKEEIRCKEMLYLYSKTYSCYAVASNKFKFSSKGFSKRVLEQRGDGPLDKYCRVLDEK